MPTGAGWLQGVRLWTTFHLRRALERSLRLTLGTPRTAAPATRTVYTFDGIQVARVRVGVGLMAVVIAFFDSSEPPVLLEAIQISSLIYLGYACLACGLLRRCTPTTIALAQAYTVDAGAFLVFVLLAGVTGSAFSYFTFFPFLLATMTASLGQGFPAGLRLTATTAGLFTLAMLVRAFIVPGVDTFRVMLRLGLIVGLGSAISRWGGHHLMLSRRLALLREAGTLSNPRFGIDRAAGLLLERLRTFYEADLCALVTAGPGGAWRVRRCDRRRPRDILNEEVVLTKLEEAVLSLPRDALAVYRPRRPWRSTRAGWWCVQRQMDGEGDDRIACTPAHLDSVLAQLGKHCFLSVPAHYRQQWIGRVYMTGSKEFESSDVEFVLQAVEIGMMAIENIRLVDERASTAAEHERHRLARDIHESVIQPYIGLQFGLSAVQRTLRLGNLVTAQDEVSRLVDLTEKATDDLRRSVIGLKSETTPSGNGLLPALRRYAARFTQDTGIGVEVVGEEGARHNDRLGAELFQMGVEALSNIRRHTASTRAVIRFSQNDDYVTLQVENQNPSETRPPAFTPRSIGERAAALGGHVTVDRHRDRRTVVEIKIPI